MDTIIEALLCGQRKTTFNGIEIELKPLPRDTQKRREMRAKEEAQKILKLLN